MPTNRKSSKVEIEYVQNQLRFKGEELVVILNRTKARYDLEGWKLVYENLSTEKKLHTHHFKQLDGSFDPGERVCLISGRGKDEFVKRNQEDRFPVPHWDLYTRGKPNLIDLPRVRIRLIDKSDKVLDVVTVERLHHDKPSKSQFHVFVGHGRDRQWRDLKDHLQDQHNIRVVAYEVGPRAGYAVKEILQKMLSKSSFAVLVLTGEDVHKDGGLHARENVVHELGLFQGHFGFSRAVALIEEGVKEFSNIYGVAQIRFSKGRIRESFGDIVATIRREYKQF
jgi:predicted nucleotide-binding protein